MRKVFLFLMIMVILTSCKNNKTISNDIREIKNTDNQFKYHFNITPLPFIIEEKSKLEVKKKPIVKISTKEVETHKYEIYEVTAYTSDEQSTGKRKGHPQYSITASGEKVKENYTIACPKSLDYGTKIYIPYFKNTFTCEDRGSRITENHLDIYMMDYKNAMDFGRQKLEIHIIGEDGV